MLRVPAYLPDSIRTVLRAHDSERDQPFIQYPAECAQPERGRARDTAARIRPPWATDNDHARDSTLPMNGTRLTDERRLADPEYMAAPKLDGQRMQLHRAGGPWDEQRRARARLPRGTRRRKAAP